MVEVGLTVIAAVVAEVLHKYEVPPDAVRVVLCPLQIVLVPVTVGVGKELTVMVLVAVAVQPVILVTVTV